MGFVKLPMPKSTTKNGFTPVEPDVFNAKAVEWCEPVGHFWKLIVEAATQPELNAVMWEADRVVTAQPEGAPRRSCEKYLGAAYRTHLWRIRHGDKTFS